MKRWAVSVLAVSVAGGALAGGCSFGESGVNPPLDQIFLPGGLAVDPDDRWLYVVNSNSDLRYNAGTLVAVDLARVREDRQRTDWPDCPSPGYVADDRSERRFCCRDYFDPSILNCRDSGYIDPASTVQLGSFASSMLVERPPGAAADQRRLYVAVRAEPSVTFVDVNVEADRVRFSCRDAPEGSANQLCDDGHKVLRLPRTAAEERDDDDDDDRYLLPEEPRQLVLDPQLRLLYVAHAIDSLSLVDLCPAKPVLSAIRRPVFDSVGQWVTSLHITQPGNPGGELLVSGRDIFDLPTGVRSYYLDGAEQPCTGAPRTGLSLVPGAFTFSSAFYTGSTVDPRGTDLRGVLLSPDRSRAYLLHRNAGTLNDPQALVAVDRTPDAQGRPGNQALGFVEVCAGATEMLWHDSGRGARIFVVCFEAGQVYVVDPERLVVSAIVNTGRGPSLLSFSPSNPQVAFVIGFSDNDVSVVDLRPGSPTEYRVVQRIGFPHVRGR